MDWTLETLKLHLDERIDGAVRFGTLRFDALRAENQAAHEANQAAIEKAEVFTKERFQHSNEYREEIRELMSRHRDQTLEAQMRFLPREVFESEHAQIEIKTEANRDQLTHALTKEAFGIAMEEVQKWRATMDADRERNRGKGDGISSTAKAALMSFSAIGVLVSIGAAIISFNKISDTDPQVTRNAQRIDALVERLAKLDTTARP